MVVSLKFWVVLVEFHFKIQFSFCMHALGIACCIVTLRHLLIHVHLVVLVLEHSSMFAYAAQLNCLILPTLVHPLYALILLPAKSWPESFKSYK